MKTEDRPSFDLVISNPPFFKDSIQSKEEKRNIARHEKDFSYKDIIRNADALLNDQGFLYLLMPYSRCDEIKAFAEEVELNFHELVQIKSRSNKVAKTAIYRFSKKERPFLEKEILVYKDGSNEYSDETCKLLKKYLLRL